MLYLYLVEWLSLFMESIKVRIFSKLHNLNATLKKLKCNFYNIITKKQKMQHEYMLV